MEFCPRCNKVMVLKKKSDNSVYFCPKCGYEKKVEELVVVNVVKKRSKPSLVLIESGEEEKVLPTTTDVVCPNCGNKEAYWWTIQTRSVDEPMTLFFRCTKCSHTWREYG
ncbi:MAG: transcription factor S [Aigarchaeota archaeon]|nr:transcription factor S [Aigarchaeota archaeon]MCX8192541.1 transcription factor S [Nitrososphaeria archaeon]MDW7985723.1 transcription factor S [Nitrososphaerota archaeon]